MSREILNKPQETVFFANKNCVLSKKVYLCHPNQKKYNLYLLIKFYLL